MQCDVCKLALTPYDPGFPHPIQYIHALLVETHEPVPVPYGGDIRLRCDFCCRPTVVVYTLHTMPFLEHKKEGVTVAGYMDDGEWAACRRCVDLVAAGSWGKLARRAERSLGSGTRRAGLSRGSSMAGIRRMHNAFRDNWDGVIPKEPDDT